MRSDGLLKHLAVCLIIAVIVYAASFRWIEGRRSAKGPWEVTFRTDAAGTPALVILQTNLNISETIQFPGHTAPSTNLPRTVVFAAPPSELPFGKLLFQDPTFLPGTVTFQMFGHDIELRRRTLVIDKTECPWQRGAEIQLR